MADGERLGPGLVHVVLHDDQLVPRAARPRGRLRTARRRGTRAGGGWGTESTLAGSRGRSLGRSILRLVSEVDVALLSCRTTLGWRRNDEAFASLVREAGATCAVVGVTIGPAGALRRHPALTDLIEALAARHSARRLPQARAVVVSTVTASFFVNPPVPYAVRFDAPAALNRPGWAGAWQRAVEPRALARARVLLPLSEEAAAPLHLDGSPVVPVEVPIDRIPRAPHADIDALVYAGNPHKRALDVVCAAWTLAGAPGRLVVGGVDPDRGLRWLARCGVPEPPRVEWAGVVPPATWNLRPARAVAALRAAPRFEDHGVAPLEALSAGALLVTTPSRGRVRPALAMARELDGELVAADHSASGLAQALAAALARTDADRRAYAQRAEALLAPHRAEAIRKTVVERVLPALGVA